MRFLVDAQLPPALARWLVAQGQTAEHLLDCGLLDADDRAIWDYAVRSGAVILQHQRRSLQSLIVGSLVDEDGYLLGRLGE